MFRSKSINQCFIVLTLFVTSQTHQLQGAQSAAAAAAPSPKQTLTPEEQAAANASLFAVVKSGDVNSIKKALDVGAQVNAKDENGKTPLYWGTLLKAMIPLDMAVQQGHLGKTMTPLDMAVQQGHHQILKALLDESDYYNPYIVKLLLDHGADPNVLFDPTPLLSDDKLLLIPLFAGLKEEYWNPKKIDSWTDLLLRRLYIDYQTDKNQQFLEILKNEKYPSLAAKAMDIVTPEFMLQQDIPLEVQQEYLRSRPSVLNSKNIPAFIELEQKVRGEESQKIMGSKASSTEKEAQMQKLEQSWKNRKDEQNALLLGPTQKEHEASLAALHLEEERAMEKLLTTEREERMIRIMDEKLKVRWLPVSESTMVKK